MDYYLVVTRLIGNLVIPELKTLDTREQNKSSITFYDPYDGDKKLGIMSIVMVVDKNKLKENGISTNKEEAILLWNKNLSEEIKALSKKLGSFIELLNKKPIEDSTFSDKGTLFDIFDEYEC